MFEFIFDPVHGLPSELRNEFHRKYAWGEVPYYLHIWNIIYYIPPLTIIVVLTIKAVGFLKIKQGLISIFAIYYDDIKN